MNKWFILLILTLFVSPSLAGNQKLRGPSRTRVHNKRVITKSHRIHRCRRFRHRYIRPYVNVVVIRSKPNVIYKPKSKARQQHVTIIIDSNQSLHISRIHELYYGRYFAKSKPKVYNNIEQRQ